MKKVGNRKYMTTREAGLRTGYSPRTMRRLAASGKIPHLHLGGNRYLFTHNDLTTLLKRRHGAA